MKSIVNYINEAKSASSIETWAAKAVKDLQGGSNACYFHKLGASNCKTDEMYIVIGWQGGFDKESKKENPMADGEYRICAKLAYNCDDLQCDFDVDWEMPYDKKSGDVDDTCSEYYDGIVADLYKHWEKYYKA